MMTFAFSVLKTEAGEFRAGDVITCLHDGVPWGHAVILGFSAPDQYGATYVKLARPFAYATCVGTVSPGVVTGVETFTMNVQGLDFKKVLTAPGSGERPYAMGPVNVDPRPHTA